jgi:hypothetical protein
MGILGSIGGAIKSAGGAIVDGASDVVDAAGDAAEAAVEAVETVAGSAADAVDDYVLDPVDYITGGIVNVDWDGGMFSASVGIRGVASAGVKVGEQGFGAYQDSLLSSASIDVSGDGLELSGSAGIPIGPLPYAETHINVSDDGAVDIGGRWQGTIPTPVGLLSTEGEYEFQRTPDGAWAAGLDAEGTLMMPSGTYVGGGVSVHHVETADGDSMTSVGVTGVVGEKGVGEVGGGIGYQHIEQDGVEIDIVTGEGYASGFGLKVEGEAGYTRIETEDGTTVEHFEASGSAEGYGMSASAEAEYLGVTQDGVTQSEWRTDSNFDGGALEDAIGDLGSGSITPASAPVSSQATASTAPGVEPNDIDAIASSSDPLASGETADIGAVSQPEPEPQIDDVAPASDFDTRIDSIDEFDDQMINDMFDGQ